jgi:hypothetical protein
MLRVASIERLQHGGLPARKLKAELGVPMKGSPQSHDGGREIASLGKQGPRVKPTPSVPP